MAERIQRKRTKGWRMPDGAISVARPGEWGNPFIVNPHARPGSKSGAIYICVPTVEDAVACYREMLVKHRPDIVEKAKSELRGRDLACFCPLDQPCHADVLLEIANALSPEIEE